MWQLKIWHSVYGILSRSLPCLGDITLTHFMNSPPETLNKGELQPGEWPSWVTELLVFPSLTSSVASYLKRTYLLKCLPHPQAVLPSVLWASYALFRWPSTCVLLSLPPIPPFTFPMDARQVWFSPHGVPMACLLAFVVHGHFLLPWSGSHP